MLTSTKLDDWTYGELMGEGLAMLPSFAPEWTNFNASDPGITFLELFAYFTELLIFQTGQITTKDRQAFLSLLSSNDLGNVSSLEDAMVAAVLALRQPERAVTCEDYEALAVRASVQVARAKCVPILNLEEKNDAARRAVRPGHVSVVLAFRPETSLTDVSSSIRDVKLFLEPRRILSTRVHVVRARRVDFEVHLQIGANPGVTVEMAVNETCSALNTFFDAITGGSDGKGWPMGRHVFLSDIYAVVSRLDTVDFVAQQFEGLNGKAVPELTLTPADTTRLYRNGSGDIIGIQLAPDELPGAVLLDVRGKAGGIDESRNL